MKSIEKKILPKYFRAVRKGEKNFELRKDEDNAQTGDVLILMEWENGEYTGRKKYVGSGMCFGICRNMG